MPRLRNQASIRLAIHLGAAEIVEAALDRLAQLPPVLSNFLIRLLPLIPHPLGRLDADQTLEIESWILRFRWGEKESRHDPRAGPELEKGGAAGRSRPESLGDVLEGRSRIAGAKAIILCVSGGMDPSTH